MDRIYTRREKFFVNKELTFFMSSFPQKETQISEPLPCPECGLLQMVRIVENCRLHDGFTVKRLLNLFIAEKLFRNQHSLVQQYRLFVNERL
jgi:hypothetical protein